MSKKYQHLLSPIKVGNIVFKNRLAAAPSRAKFIQGSEPYPTEAMITHYANKARNGAALVTCGGFEASVKIEAQKLFGHNGYVRYRVIPDSEKEGGPFIGLMEHAHDQESYLSQMTEAVHFYGARASIALPGRAPHPYDVSAGIPIMSMPGDPFHSGVSEEVPVDLIDGIAEDFAIKAALMKNLGFDMIYLPMAYRTSLPGRFLSPLINKRTDEFGGSLANRARFALIVADRIKQKCGRNFLIETSISGCEPPGGYSLEDAIEYAKIFAGHFDLLQIRAGTVDAAHPTGFNLNPTPTLYMAEAIKKGSTDIAVVTIGGYQDLDLCEDVIASGKADFISMARSWICDPEYGRKAYEGRGEDVVPCIRCEKCHTSSYSDTLASVCSVNPNWGFEHKIERMIQPSTGKKKVAIIGGGPAGMEAALVASGRGHKVTLYEKSGALGGLLRTVERVSFKWPLKKFRDYMVRQIEKSDVKVCLNTEATAEMIHQEEYDAIFAAVGSEPAVPPIPGINGKNVIFAQDVYGTEDTLAENLVIIGGGEVGVETGMHLAELGHQITVLEMGEMLVPEAVPAHYYNTFKETWERLSNFKSILNARCTAVSRDKVTYTDSEGKEHNIDAGSMIIATGMQPKNDLALKFYGSADRFFIIGDCNDVGNVQKAMRSAFSTACML